MPLNEEIPCLCILFNHPYPDNIAVLEKIYRRRFPSLKFIIPFVSVPDNSDVITVYRGSYVHNAFVTDAFSALKDVNCSHFIFVQDDVLLNPALDAENFADSLGLTKNDGYVSRMHPIDADLGSIEFVPGWLWRWRWPANLLSGTGVDSANAILKNMPEIPDLAAKLQRYGLLPRARFHLTESTLRNSRFSQINSFGSLNQALDADLKKTLVQLLYDQSPERDIITVDFPLVHSGWASDFYVVPKRALKKYCHISGLLAAIGVFAEQAVGTALILSADNVRNADDANVIVEWHMGSLSEVIAKMRSSRQFIAAHPMKLSHFIGREHEVEQLLFGS